MYLVDSTIVIDYLRGRKEVVELLNPLLDQQEAATSLVVYAEVLEGLVFRSKTSAPEMRREFEAVIGAMFLIPPDQIIAECFADIRAHLRTIGQLLPDHDIWIAATALSCRATIITDDSDFDRIPKLRTKAPRRRAG
jgi:predicted nucleic acid-binding protein